LLKRIFAFILILSVIVVSGIVGYFLYLYNSTRFDTTKIVFYNPPISARFYDRNNKLIAVRYKDENRFYAKFNEIPGRVIEALIATEDTSFFEHKGVNFNAILRAIIKDIKTGKKVEGASTITQQLVRTIYLNRKKTIKRKIKEIIIALKVEKLLTKEEILERYFNQIYFGHGYYGIKTAAFGYFHKGLKDLSLKEIAMLVALPKAPSLYDPVRNYELNIKRANRILKRMYLLGWISANKYKESILEQPKVYKYMVKESAPYAIDTAILQLLPKHKDLFTRGYKIYLTIDSKIQQIGQDAIKWNYERVLSLNPELDPNKLNGALVSINPHTGEVLAIVGGVDYKKSKFNRAVQSKRSIGSAVKPFIYQTALNIGYNPGSLIPDIRRTFKISSDTPQEDKYWKPKNYEKNTLGLITLREALVHSRNLATINLVLSMGLDTVLKNMYKFGFDKLPDNLSIALGSFGESPWQLSELYTIFSNYGTRSKVYLIRRIEVPKDNVKIEITPSFEYIQPSYQAYLIVDILKDVVNKGTGRNAKVKGIEIAGKTGTTNNFVDAWWCGFSPDIQTVIWFGNDDSTSLGENMTGGKVSAPAFRFFYKKLLALHPEMNRKFKIPSEIKTYILNGKEELFTPLSPPPQHEEYVPLF
jgi:penicillin-binding protein 1A